MAPALLIAALIALPIVVSSCLAYAGYEAYKRRRHAPHDVERARNFERTRQNDERGIQMQHIARPQRHNIFQYDGDVGVVPANVAPVAKPLPRVHGKHIEGGGVAWPPEHQDIRWNGQKSDLNDGPFEEIDLYGNPHLNNEMGQFHGPALFREVGTVNVVSPRPMRLVATTVNTYLPNSPYDAREMQVGDAWDRIEKREALGGYGKRTFHQEPITQDNRDDDGEGEWEDEEDPHEDTGEWRQVEQPASSGPGASLFSNSFNDGHTSTMMFEGGSRSSVNSLEREKVDEVVPVEQQQVPSPSHSSLKKTNHGNDRQTQDEPLSSPINAIPINFPQVAIKHRPQLPPARQRANTYTDGPVSMANFVPRKQLMRRASSVSYKPSVEGEKLAGNRRETYPSDRNVHQRKTSLLRSEVNGRFSISKRGNASVGVEETGQMVGECGSVGPKQEERDSGDEVEGEGRRAGKAGKEHL
ncbi:uncharacterized protein K460DRAFT_407642 [Cucurbitaria berberidis CBS 394.84]|uniref:Uncharacterized protein n=1 Tax=Cucurbitaria berberidis CBS 394.84 TaxID=1168544 RepID=A0A9P4L6E4_9PLEO|nr:uncharacterized protein K460DRAFT_407642 [Cucurbitaria berberidis CBS 394.84]KAF1843277.1 hypothetical protein K460DRAFT_407642 [Cucurbitaria berberidis CBS 394.84]